MVPGSWCDDDDHRDLLRSAEHRARKELGTLEQLNVHAITSEQLIVAKLLPFWVLGLRGVVVGPDRGESCVSGSRWSGAFCAYAVAGGLFRGRDGPSPMDSYDRRHAAGRADFVNFFIIKIYMMMKLACSRDRQAWRPGCSRVADKTPCATS